MEDNEEKKDVHDWHKAANKTRDDIFKQILGLTKKEEPKEENKKEEDSEDSKEAKEEDFEIPKLELDEPEELFLDPNSSDPFNMGDMFSS